MLAHLPLEHTVPPGHGLLQPPQSAGLLAKSTQALLQAESGAVQESWQAPLTHAAEPPAGAAQAFPQAPQFPGSPFRLTQPVPHGEKFLSQAKAQEPFTQTPAPFGGELHVALQPPQLSGSVAREAHVPSHSTVPV
jgi:hypothetical protein